MKRLAKEIAQNINTKDDTSKVKKTSYELKLEEEKEKRCKEKEELKKFTPTELRLYNRKKLEPKEEVINTVDDQKVDNFTFEKALVYSEKTAKLYNDLKTGKLKDEDQVVCEALNEEKHSNSSSSARSEKDVAVVHRQSKKPKHDSKIRVKIDATGKIEGEKIEGLVRREIKKEKVKSASESQDMYILEKLFQKKGVHSALKHDEVVGTSSSKELEKIRISSDAKRKADIALEALRKSRLKSWRW